MSTIFDVSFGKNLERIFNKSARDNSSSKKTPEADFQALLRGLEKPNEDGTLASSKHAFERPDKAVPMLSNFTVNEWDEQASELIKADVADTQDAKAPLVEPRKIGLNVNASQVSVKTLTDINPVLTTPESAEISPASTIPSKPNLISANFIAPTAMKVSKYQPTNISEMINQTGRKHGLDPDLALAVAKAESSLRTDAVSTDGHSTKGLFQLLDTTALEMKERLALGEQEYDPFNPKMNAELGVGYLRYLHDIFSEETVLKGTLTTTPAKTSDDLEKLAVASFNTGQGNVARAQRRAQALGKNPGEFLAVKPHLAPETRTYVERVLAFRDSSVLTPNKITTA